MVSSLHLVNFYFCHLPLSTNISQKYNADKTTRSRHLFRNSNIISCTRSVSSNSSDKQFCVQVDNCGEFVGRRERIKIGNDVIQIAC